MTNKEKYKTTKEQDNAFINFCCNHKCGSCPFYSIYMTPYGNITCREAWLELEAEEEYHEKEVEKK